MITATEPSSESYPWHLNGCHALAPSDSFLGRIIFVALRGCAKPFALPSSATSQSPTRRAPRFMQVFHRSGTKLRRPLWALSTWLRYAL